MKWQGAGFFLSTEQMLANAICFGSLIALALLFYASVIHFSGHIGALTFLSMSVLPGVGCGYYVTGIRRWLSHPARPGIILTPLYFIRTTATTLVFHPLWQLSDYGLTKVYSHGIYSHTEVLLRFGAHEESFTMILPRRVERFSETFGLFVSRLRDAINSRNADYFAQHDIFKELDSRSISQEGSSAEHRRTKLTYAVSIAASVILAVVALEANGKLAIQPVTSMKHQAQAQELFELPPPRSGIVHSYSYDDHIAPLSISASSEHHHFVKLVSVASRRTVVTIFVPRGTTTEVDVPLGQYYMRYASGTKWYGTAHLFGTETDYYSAHEPLNFTLDYDGVIGHTIKLFRVRGGNLRTRGISASEF